QARHVSITAVLVFEQQRRLQIAQHGTDHFNVVHHMPVQAKDVGVPVAVVVEEGDAPTRMQQARPAYSDRKADVRKEQFALVAVERVAFIRKISDDNVLLAISIEIARSDSHSGLGLTLAAVSSAGEFGHLGEAALAIVNPEKVRKCVIRHVQVRVSVTVEVGGYHPKSLAGTPS